MITVDDLTVQSIGKWKAFDSAPDKLRDQKEINSRNHSDITFIWVDNEDKPKRYSAVTERIYKITTQSQYLNSDEEYERLKYIFIKENKETFISIRRVNTKNVIDDSNAFMAVRKTDRFNGQNIKETTFQMEFKKNDRYVLLEYVGNEITEAEFRKLIQKAVEKLNNISDTKQENEI